jgi:hypothetical protein
MSYLDLDTRFVQHRPQAGGRRLVSYAAREGDLIFFHSHNPAWNFLYRLAGTEPPDHSGMVVCLPDGTPALLEAGPLGVPRVRLSPWWPRLHDFPGSVWVRRFRGRLSRQRSAALTRFALAQVGKAYAVVRLFMQLTPFCARRWWKSRANTDLGRRTWFCSELLVASATVAGLVDPQRMPANTVYPRDIVDDCRLDISHAWWRAALWRAGAPGGVQGVRRAA